MNKTDYNTGWSTRAFIEVKKISCRGFIDEWKCSNSGEPIEDELLIVERSNFKHRGNETDETYCYNRSSTPEKYMKVWKKWDKKKEEKKKEVENIAKSYNFKVTIG